METEEEARAPLLPHYHSGARRALQLTPLLFLVSRKTADVQRAEEESGMSHLSAFQALCRSEPHRLDHRNIKPTPSGDKNTAFLCWKSMENVENSVIPVGTG